MDYYDLLKKYKYSLILVIILIIIFLSYYYIMRSKFKRVVVFDLDETIGCFQQLGIFCDAIEKQRRKKLTRNDFMEILDLYPEYFRPHLFEIMKFLKQKKIKGDLHRVCLYTNNNGPKEWARRICLYIDNKIDYKLFDNHIGAYMVDGHQVEPMRTTYDKTVNDFLRTTRLPNHTEICFIDDLYHEKMDDGSVYYIHVEPYTVKLPTSVLSERYYKYFHPYMSYNDFYNIINNYMKRYNLSDLNSKNVDHNLTGKNILFHLENFIQPISKSTRRNKQDIKNKTIKR